jgi:hypothetical protein
MEWNGREGKGREGKGRKGREENLTSWATISSPRATPIHRVNYIRNYFWTEWYYKSSISNVEIIQVSIHIIKKRESRSNESI